jgi:hypothetical protein
MPSKLSELHNEPRKEANLLPQQICLSVAPSFISRIWHTQHRPRL